MNRNTEPPMFDINKEHFPMDCLPKNLDKAHLVDVTTLGCAWKVYIDTVTGVIHDGKVYYQQYLEKS